MEQFDTLDAILDFAITQEQAAQVFYTHLAAEATDPEKAAFYRELAAQERRHEEALCELKRSNPAGPTPDLEDLRQCGYLDAMPLHPGVSWKELLEYIIKKEKSAKMLYTVLANSTAKAALSELFQWLADQEAAHADYFKTEYQNTCLNAD